MSLFGRNKNKEEIEEIKKEINDVKQSIVDLNEDYEDKSSKLKNCIESENKNNKSLFEQYENKFLELDSKMDNINERIDGIIEFQHSLVDKLAKLTNVETKKTKEKKVKTKKDGKKGSYDYMADLYSGLHLSGENILGKRNRKLPYTINDVISIKENLDDYSKKGYSGDKIGRIYGIGTNTIQKVIYNIQQGVFDDLIEEYLSQRNKMAEPHLRKVSKSLQKKVNGDFLLGDGGELYTSGGRALSYNIQEVLMVQERIPNFNDYPTFEDLGEGIDMTMPSIKTLVWRIEEGCFDGVIQEYLSRNYTYENNFNRLFIDGSNTGLSINSCVSIVECIINAPNKLETVNKLIKMYPTIESKYIRILADEYNNPNLGKVLKKEVRKIPKIDNPQKRKEAGVFQ